MRAIWRHGMEGWVASRSSSSALTASPISSRRMRTALFRSLKRCQARDCRGLLATACTPHAAATGGLGALVMYDVTTLHFETGDEDTGPDALRKVGMSKEHRVGPQVQVGLSWHSAAH